MIKKLRLNFITLAMISLLVAVMLVCAIVGVITFSNVSRENDFIINFIIEHNGQLKDSIPNQTQMVQGRDYFKGSESVYETRFISARFNETNNITALNVDHVFSVNDDTATTIIKDIISNYDMDGVYKYDKITYSYKYVRDDKQSDFPYLIVLIDVSSKISIATTIFYYMLGVSAAILVVYIFIYSIYSKRIVKPYIEAHDSQKRFITNASHELKTPLAVISANTEMIEALNGESKWTTATLAQIKKMTELINQLVTLSRMNEKEYSTFKNINISKAVKDAAESFSVVTTNSGKQFNMDIDDDLEIIGDEKSISELTIILLDNATKYCDDGGLVFASLKKISNSKCKLSISNDYKEGKDIDVSKFFERFYRQDESHNNKKSGFGIGLSIALQIAEKHNSKLEVDYKEPKITFSATLKLATKKEEKKLQKMISKTK